MMYADYLSTAEWTRWNLDLDIAWDRIDRDVALSQPDLLDRIHDSALIESFFPIFTPRALDVLWDDVNATAVFSIQLYESYKHFHGFNQYLHLVDYRPVSDEEVIEVRRRNEGLKYSDGTSLLTRYMISEHFAAYHFMKDSRQANEQVLAHILSLVGKDEVRHSQFAYDLLADRLARCPQDADKVIQGVREFEHVGLSVVDEVPVAEKNAFSPIISLNQRIKRLTGKSVDLFGQQTEVVAGGGAS